MECRNRREIRLRMKLLVKSNGVIKKGGDANVRKYLITLVMILCFLLINGFMGGLGWAEDQYEQRARCRQMNTQGLTIYCGEFDEIDQCNACPKLVGCVKREPAGDGCNIQTRYVWCEKGKW